MLRSSACGACAYTPLAKRSAHDCSKAPATCVQRSTGMVAREVTKRLPTPMTSGRSPPARRSTLGPSASTYCESSAAAPVLACSTRGVSVAVVPATGFSHASMVRSSACRADASRAPSRVGAAVVAAKDSARPGRSPHQRGGRAWPLTAASPSVTDPVVAPAVLTTDALTYREPYTALAPGRVWVTSRGSYDRRSTAVPAAIAAEAGPYVSRSSVSCSSTASAST